MLKKTFLILFHQHLVVLLVKLMMHLIKNILLKKKDGSYTGETQWEKPSQDQMCKSETKQPSVRQKTWDDSKTIGSCREVDLHPGTEYWINPTTGKMSFEQIEGVKKQVVSKETDYFYNAKGQTTKDPYDGTCDISKENSSEVKNVEPKKDYIKLFFFYSL